MANKDNRYTAQFRYTASGINSVINNSFMKNTRKTEKPRQLLHQMADS